MSVDLENMRVLVTTTSFGKTDPTLRSKLEAKVGSVTYNSKGRPLSADELADQACDVDGIIAGLDDIDASVIGRAKKLKVISRYGIGVDRVDLKAATENRIVVTNTPGANSLAVAELTLGFILGLARNICTANDAVHKGVWSRCFGIGMRGKTVGLIGLGAIGQEVARRLMPFGCTITASDPAVSPAVASEVGVRLVPLAELYAEADFISLHVPATAETIGLIDDPAFQQMKKGVYLINTARGELIDEEALKTALDSGHLRGAALDVFREEPIGKDHFLRRYSQVILAPHMGAHTDEAMNQMGRCALEDCLAVLKGDRPQYPVNPEVYE